MTSFDFLLFNWIVTIPLGYWDLSNHCIMYLSILPSWHYLQNHWWALDLDLLKLLSLLWYFVSHLARLHQHVLKERGIGIIFIVLGNLTHFRNTYTIYELNTFNCRYWGKRNILCGRIQAKPLSYTQTKISMIFKTLSQFQVRTFSAGDPVDFEELSDGVYLHDVLLQMWVNHKCQRSNRI